MLIATLPPVYRLDMLREVIACPSVGSVRYNTGMVSPHSPEDTLRIIKALTDEFEKKVWIDLKGRQLRITRWALPDYGNIVINHEVEVDGDAWVYIRGGERLSLKFARGKILYVDPRPRQAVGEGQSLNIVGDHVRIKGYLTENDRAYIRAAKKVGMNRFMLSFVEHEDDISQVITEFGLSEEGVEPVKLILKIESPAGMTFAEGWKKNTARSETLMAARDDLFITLGENKRNIIRYLRELVSADPSAICASRLFSGLENTGELSLSDITDIEFMKSLGYKNFMFSDEICQVNFRKAIEAWDSI